MMKSSMWLLTLILCSCNNRSHESNNNVVTRKSFQDTIAVSQVVETEIERPAEFSNKRFREVTVEKVGPNKYRIKGEAQIFEATFSWVVEDGHYELYKGFEMTDAGAPEWGKFDFTVDAQKKDENTTLHLILFEISAKDGTRQYGLPIPLH